RPAASDTESGADVRVDNPSGSPADSHFFVAVCALRPQTGAPTFVYIPRVANLLRERERHIELLEQELETKNQWLERTTAELAQLNADHQTVLAQYRALIAESEEPARWAERLKRELEQQGVRMVQLQRDLAEEQAGATPVIEGYEAKIRELERENEEKTHWAMDTEARLGKELAEKGQELAKCVELLHQAE